jgi:hypothetical protein
MLVRIAIAALVSTGLVAAHAAAQGVPVPTVILRHEIVQGTVTAAPVPTIPNAIGKPLADVDVIVTRGPDRAYKSSKTDAAGHYTIDWPDGTGDYLVHVAAAGWPPATYLANLPDQYEAHEAYRRAEEGIDGAWEVTRVDLQRNLPAILNPVQLQLIPSVVKTLINSQGPVRIRLFITGG